MFYRLMTDGFTPELPRLEVRCFACGSKVLVHLSQTLLHRPHLCCHEHIGREMLEASELKIFGHVNKLLIIIL